MFSKFRFFKPFLIKNRQPIENTVLGCGLFAYAYNLPSLLDTVAKNEIRLFELNLSPEQKKEMDSSPEMNRKYRNECIQQFCDSMRP